MTNPVSSPAGSRSEALARRLEAGAEALAALAATMTEAEMQVRIPNDGRTVGVVVHHVASVYPLEVKLALQMAAGEPIAGVTWDAVHAMNAQHAADNAAVTRDAAVGLLRRRSVEAAAALRKLGDAELDRAVPVSMYGDAPLTCQFFLEDHAVRHSWHHLAKIRAALGRA